MTSRELLWDALRRDPRVLVRIAFWSVLEAAPAFLIGHAIARAIDQGFVAGRPETGLAWLALLGIVWVVAAVAARQVVLAVADVAEPFRDRLLSQVVEGSLRRAAAWGRPPDTAMVARSTLQVELARDSFAAVITVVRSFVFTVASVILGMSTLIPRVLPLVLPPFCLGLAIFACSLRALARRQRAFILADERTVEAFGTVAGGLRDIAACGAEDRVGDRVGRSIAAQAAAGRALARVTALRTLALSVGGWLPVLTVLAGTPWLVRHGADAGVIIGVLAYLTQSLTPALSGLVQGLGVGGVRLIVTLNRIMEGSAAPPAAVRDRTPNGPQVELRAVTFAYGPHAEPVIDELSLTVPEGDHLAVVGPSGIGKSTLAALITGMLAPGSGGVLVGGEPAAEVDPSARVLIPQEAYVFRGTLWENLTYLAPDASADAVDNAVSAIGMTALAQRIGGYGGELDPGALSAGERQLIALVRAYLAPARLTILDEATCHLDQAAEAAAEAAFVRRGGTLIVVAHRLGSAHRARRVLFMDGARVRLGTSDELVRTAPGYAELMGRWVPPPNDQKREFV
jgi:ATP-binding cassette, subfamily B, bacterial RamB/AmfA